MNADEEIWPPPPDTETRVQPAALNRKSRVGAVSLIVSVIGLALLLALIMMASMSVARRLPYGFLGNGDMVALALLLLGLVCGISGRHLLSGKIGLSVSAGGLCLAGILVAIDLHTRGVI